MRPLKHEIEERQGFSEEPLKPEDVTRRDFDRLRWMHLWGCPWRTVQLVRNLTQDTAILTKLAFTFPEYTRTAPMGDEFFTLEDVSRADFDAIRRLAREFTPDQIAEALLFDPEAVARVLSVTLFSELHLKGV